MFIVPATVAIVYVMIFVGLIIWNLYES
jgi:hypothetical protein